MDKYETKFFSKNFFFFYQSRFLKWFCFDKNCSYLPCDVFEVNSLENVPTYDTICVIESEPPFLSHVFKDHRSFDKAFDSEVCIKIDRIAVTDECNDNNNYFEFQVTCLKEPNRNIRIVNAPLGELDDFDDVRVYARASGKAISRAIQVMFKLFPFQSFFFSINFLVFNFS